MSRSEKKTDAWGNEYTQHYDDSGNKIGWSETKTGAWGNSYEQHYDSDGSKSGWSETNTDAWGGSYGQHYDQDGDKSGWSEAETDAWGGHYDQHYEQDSTKRGWSQSRTDAWGNPYEQNYRQDGSKSGSKYAPASRSVNTGREQFRSAGKGDGSYLDLGQKGGGSAPASGTGAGGIAIIIVLVLAIGLAGSWGTGSGSSGRQSTVTGGNPGNDGSARVEARIGPITQYDVDHPPAPNATAPSGGWDSGRYALAHTLVRYDNPQIRYAPGLPSLRWRAPMHAEPTTLSARLRLLEYNQRVTSQGFVQGPDGQTWEIVTTSDGTLGFVKQEELRTALPSQRENSLSVISEDAAEPAAQPSTGQSEAAEDSRMPPPVSEAPDLIEVDRGPYDGKPD
jgi:hypothetical protein